MITALFILVGLLVIIIALLCWNSGQMAYKIGWYEHTLDEHWHHLGPTEKRRYTNVKRGRKWYDYGPGPELPLDPEPPKFNYPPGADNGKV